MSGASMIATNGLVDFHCHLDLYPDHQAAVRESEEAGVFTLAVCGCGSTGAPAWHVGGDARSDGSKQLAQPAGARRGGRLT